MTAEPVKRWLLVAAGSFLVMAGGVTLWRYKPWRQVEDVATLSAKLDEQVARADKPWERPVLRGDALHENAQQAQLKAVAGMQLPEAWPASDFYAAFEEEARYAEDIAREQAALDRLLDAARMDISWRDTSLAEGQTAIELPQHRYAYRLLLLRGKRQGVDACLRSCVDVLRLAGDLVAGAGIGPLVNLEPVTDDVRNILMACSREAPKNLLARTRDELTGLIRKPVPLGRALEEELILLSVTLRAVGRAGAEMDVDSRQLWGFIGESIERVRDLTAGDLPNGIDVTAAELNRLAALGLPGASTQPFAKLYGNYVHRYAYARAQLRMMIVGIEALLSGERKAPPAAAARKELADPFTGAPLHWLPIDKCSALLTLGPNKKLDSYVAGNQLMKQPDDEHHFVCFER